MKYLYLPLIVLFFSFTMQKDKPAYNLFTKEGKAVSYAKMLADLAQADVILFGEYHDNPISHWLQLEVTKALGKKKTLVLGAEMFEADIQIPLNEWMAAEEKTEELFDTLRAWPNYKTDYAPLVNYAAQNKLPFIATNIPRRYASQVFKKGIESLDSLSDQEKSWIAPQPMPYDAELPGYKAMLEMMEGHGGENFPKAQAIKDATMAHFILKNWENGKLFIHYNGAYHSNNFEGIGWYLKKYNPEVKVKTISTVSQVKLKGLTKENKGLADYIIAVSETMTSTH